MEERQNQNIVDVPFKVSAKISAMKIDKDLNFNSKIIWKRHQKKTQTQIVPHIQGYSTYDQTLSLNLMMKYNKLTGKYLEKITKFLSAIVTDKGLRSGGEAKFNVADPLNREISSTGYSTLETNQTLSLDKCPDETGYIEVFFSYERLDQNQQITSSVIHNSEISSLIFEDKSSSFASTIYNVVSALPSVVTSTVSSVLSKNNSSTASKEGSFFMKKSANLERELETLEKKWISEKQELQMKILMMQEQMKEYKNRLVDRDQELKHIKVWNESLIKSSENNLSKIRIAEVKQNELEIVKLQRQNLIEKVVTLEKLVVNKTTIIGNLLNTACDIGGRSLLNQLSKGMSDISNI